MRSKFQKYVVDNGNSTRNGELAVVIEETYTHYHCRRIKYGKPMKCPDSRCSTGCVGCCSVLRKDHVYFLNADEINYYIQEKMIPNVSA